jgi:hypothetical protein
VPRIKRTRRPINLNIEAAALAWLREESARSGRSMSDLVNEAVYNLSCHDERLLQAIRQIVREELAALR